MKTTMEIITDWMLITASITAGAIALIIAFYWLTRMLDKARKYKDDQDRIMDRHIMPKRERGEG